LTENLLVANFHSSPKKGGRMRSPPLLWLCAMKVVRRMVPGDLSLFLQANAAQANPSGADFFGKFEGVGI